MPPMYEIRLGYPCGSHGTGQSAVPRSPSPLTEATTSSVGQPRSDHTSFQETAGVAPAEIRSPGDCVGSVGQAIAMGNGPSCHSYPVPEPGSATTQMCAASSGSFADLTHAPLTTTSVPAASEVTYRCFTVGGSTANPSVPPGMSICVSPPDRSSTLLCSFPSRKKRNSPPLCCWKNQSCPKSFPAIV